MTSTCRFTCQCHCLLRTKIEKAAYRRCRCAVSEAPQKQKPSTTLGSRSGESWGGAGLFWSSTFQYPSELLLMPSHTSTRLAAFSCQLLRDGKQGQPLSTQLFDSSNRLLLTVAYAKRLAAFLVAGVFRCSTYAGTT